MKPSEERKRAMIELIRKSNLRIKAEKTELEAKKIGLKAAKIKAIKPKPLTDSEKKNFINSPTGELLILDNIDSHRGTAIENIEPLLDKEKLEQIAIRELHYVNDINNILNGTNNMINDFGELIDENGIRTMEDYINDASYDGWEGTNPEESFNRPSNTE